jgi:DNA-binding NtrC family response regulator
MQNKIRILIAENVEADAELMEQALREDGLAFQANRVDSESALHSYLKQHRFDLILSDHRLPLFDGFKALTIARETCPEVPFIFVTGALGEEVAIASFKHGATDYILKSRLPQLASAVRRALDEVRERASRREAERERDQLLHELQETLGQLKSLTGLLPICTLCKRIRHHHDGWQPMELFLQNHTDANLTQELCPECKDKLPPAVFRHRAPLYQSWAPGAHMA